LVETEINLLATTGAVGAARAAGVSNGDFKTLSDAFSDNEKVQTYHPLQEKQAYVDAYQAWKYELENKYIN
jgi:xylulokinase